MFKDIKATIEKATKLADKHLALCLDTKDVRALMNMYDRDFYYEDFCCALIADCFSLGFMQGQKAGRKEKKAS